MPELTQTEIEMIMRFGGYYSLKEWDGKYYNADETDEEFMDDILKKSIDEIADMALHLRKQNKASRERYRILDNQFVELQRKDTDQQYLDDMAGRAMQGFCADPSYPLKNMDALAEQSYDIADAMLAEKKRRLSVSK